MQKIFNVAAAVVIAGLAFGFYFLATHNPASGTPLFERMKWVGEKLYVGTTEPNQGAVDPTNSQFYVDGTTGDVCVNDACTRRITDDTMTQGTTTPIALRSPTTATSTLDLSNTYCRFDRSTTTASRITLAKARTAFATTSLIGVMDVSANAQATLRATTSAATDANLTFAPGDYLVVGMAGGTGTFSPDGTCVGSWLYLD